MPIPLSEAQEANWKQKQEDREREQKEHNDKMLIRVTLIGVIVTLVVGTAGFWAAYEAHKTRVEDQRPFVGVEVSPDETQTIYLTNIGKSPAVHIQTRCMVRPSEERIRWSDLDSKPITQVNLIYLLPSRRDTAICPHVNKEVPIQGGETDYGIVRYEDDHGRHYQTPFCIDTISDPKTNKIVIQSGCSGNYEQIPEVK